jgi:hypothetical protein
MTVAYEIVEHSYDVRSSVQAGQDCARRSEWPHQD